MNRFKIWTGTLFGAGLLPYGPGTWGSLFSLSLIYGAAFLFPVFGVFIFLLIAMFLSLWTAPASIEAYGDDPARFVMDETAGQAVVFLFTPFTFTLKYDLMILTGGFLLFRFFDILKPLGIRKLEKISGKFGILADDLLAGVYALICLTIVLYLI